MPDIRNIEQSQYVDLFGEQSTQTAPVQAGQFGTSPQTTDLFNSTTDTTTSSTTDTTTITSTEETTTLDPSTTETTTIISLFKEDGSEKEKPKESDVVPFKDMFDYISDRVKQGKFTEFEIQNEDGTTSPFVPKTPEEFDQLLEFQIEHNLSKQKETLEKNWYSTKTPAWKAVAQYAELTDDPTEIIPFLQGIQNIESIKDVDPTEIEGAEMIVRTTLAQRGDSKEMIDEMVETLKTTAKLIPSAEKYKPALIKQESARMQQMIAEKQEEEKRYNQLVNTIRDNSIKVIEEPIVGKQKLKGEEKQAIYSLISEPSPESGGYAIYDEIDKLYEKGNFSKLRKLALLIHNEEAYDKYISSVASEKTATEVQLKIKAANDNRAASSNTNGEDRKVVIQKSQYGQRTFGKAK